MNSFGHKRAIHAAEPLLIHDHLHRDPGPDQPERLVAAEVSRMAVHLEWNEVPLRRRSLLVIGEERIERGGTIESRTAWHVEVEVLVVGAVRVWSPLPTPG